MTLGDPVILVCMFGNTYPIFDREPTLSERVRNPALADYLRWEYRPADRVNVILSARGGGLLVRSRPRPRARGLLRHIRSWARSRKIAGAARGHKTAAGE